MKKYKVKLTSEEVSDLKDNLDELMASLPNEPSLEKSTFVIYEILDQIINQDKKPTKNKKKTSKLSQNLFKEWKKIEHYD